jgi:thioredoxin-related protein
MKTYFFTVLLAMYVSATFAQTIQNQSLINWMSFEEAVAKQKENPKTIMIDMYTDWCGWCKKMDAETFSNTEIANYINTYFYPVKFNAEGTDTIIYNDKTYINENAGRRSSHQLAQLLMNGRMSYPTIVYIDFENNVNPVPGYMDVTSIEPLLVYFVERINKNCDYIDFRQDFINTFMPDSTSKTNGNINWLSFEDAVTLMKTEPKKLILFINSEYNNGSKLMVGSVLRHPQISKLISENFYLTRINYDTKDSLKLGENIFINEQKAPNYPHQLVIALLQPDIRLPSTIFFDKDFSLIFALRGYFPPKVFERYMEFIKRDLFKTGGDWEKFNSEFKSNIE